MMPHHRRHVAEVIELASRRRTRVQDPRRDADAPRLRILLPAVAAAWGLFLLLLWATARMLK